MIELIDFGKDYGDFTAVERLNLKIEAGEMFGFIAPAPVNIAARRTANGGAGVLGDQQTAKSGAHASVCGRNVTVEPHRRSESP